MTVERTDYLLPSNLHLVKMIVDDEPAYYILAPKSFYSITEGEFNVLLPLAKLEVEV